MLCADCFFKQGDLTFALADYQQAEELDPHNETIWARLAVVHNTLGLQNQKDRSRKHLKCHRDENENILVKSSGFYELNTAIHFFSTHRKYKEAAEKFSLAIKYNPGVSQYYENRANVHYKGQKLEMAKEDAISTRILDPSNHHASVYISLTNAKGKGSGMQYGAWV